MEYLRRVKVDEERERFVQSAFIGWQLGAGGGKGFVEYLEALNIYPGRPMANKKNLSPEEVTANTQRILEKLKKIGK